MYENMTYETILERMLSRVSVDVDKSEGSLIYNAIAPEAWELAQAYIEIDYIYNSTFADTAPREELVKRAKERGIEPKAATHAVLSAKVNIDINIGTRFSNDNINYYVKEKISEGIYKLECETAGTAGNKRYGELIPIEYIEGFESAEINELLIPAENEEDTEVFRKRYFETFNSQSFGGNKADYRRKTEEIQGVGRAKYYRANKNRSYIVIQIINSEYGVPSKELIDLVQTTLDPTQNQGEGDGLAPIGHVVNVEGVIEEIINISSKFTLKEGYVWQDIEESVNACIDTYFKDLSKEWADMENVIIKISQINAKILDIAGIEDITDTRINGYSNNITLPENAIPKRGNVSAN